MGKQTDPSLTPSGSPKMLKCRCNVEEIKSHHFISKMEENHGNNTRWPLICVLEENLIHIGSLELLTDHLPLYWQYTVYTVLSVFQIRMTYAKPSSILLTLKDINKYLWFALSIFD